MVRSFFIGLVFGGFFANAQKTEVSGKVTEAQTGTPIPFATVVFKGTTEGAITDFDGNFTAITSLPVDSIQVSYIGFVTRTKPVIRGEAQVINFQLEEDVTTLNEVVVTPGENPAFPVMRQVIKNKPVNDKRSLEAYDYESYVRTEFDLDNISDEMRRKKIMQKALSLLDSMEQIAGEDGKPILPLMVSEAISRFYFRSNPFAKHEYILRTKVSGIGITDGTLTSQLIGSTYQEYNFYQNWLNIAGKEFASPIANGWKMIYEYELIDSLYVGDDYCYKLEFFPKQPQDLAFTGTMWITKKEYALKQIDAYVSGTANLNFIEKIKIQQELVPTPAGPWLPSKTRVVLDIKPISPNTAGFLAKFYISNKDFNVNQPKEDRFYMNTVTLAPDVRTLDEAYWQHTRHDSLTTLEMNVFSMIDSLKNIPAVRNITEAAKIASTGYIKTGILDIGPYTTFYGNNDVEGVRVGFGARTNIDFSNKWVLGGYTGYGFEDHRWKYLAELTWLANRDQWTEIKYTQQREIEQVWLLNMDIDANSLFYSLSRFGTLTQPFLKQKYKLSFQRQLGQGLHATSGIKHQQVSPLFNFRYFTDDTRSSTASDYKVTEGTFSIRYGKDEIILINDNQRINLGPIRFPVYTFTYTYATDRLGGDFEFHKLQASIQKRQKMGLFGVSDFQVAGGYLFGTVPYTLLFNPIGNETPVYVGFAYNLMDFFEFSSDRYVELKYRHAFEGFILNRIPLIRKLKWRLFLSANVLQGAIRQENIDLTDFDLNTANEPILPFRTWNRTPYVEVGYGIENILKILSIHAFHRLTYLENDARGFGLKFSASINF